jgi:prepilin-type N-terminal cleavage/methylation domain-containing protein
VPARTRSCEPEAGFTLLEVLVALTILSLAVVTLIQLSSQSLRLVKNAADYQGAVQLAQRIVTENQPTDEGVDSGEDGRFRWERRVSLVLLPDEFQPKQIVPNREPPKLFVVTIDVRWGGDQVLELATLRTPTASPAPPHTTPGGPQPTSPATGRPATPLPMTR